MLLAVFLSVANCAASAKVQPPSSCKGALANPEVYAAVREAAQATVNRLEGREVTFRDTLHELHNNILGISRNDPVVQNEINKLRSQLSDEIAKQTTSPLGQQIKACFPMLDELLRARERAAEQRKQDEDEEKKVDPSSCLGALTDPEGVLKFESFNPEGPKSARHIAARLRNPRLQAMAKEVVGTLEAEPLTTADITNPAPNLARRVQEFKWRLGAKLNNERDRSGAMLFSNEFSWTQGMTPDQAFACFPDLAAMARTYEARAKAAQEAARQREQEEAQRQTELGKIPKVVLGTAYLAYLDVKRCYEARESYAVGYITFQEMELARNTVRQIEDAIRPKLDLGTTTDDIWSSYMKYDQHFYPSRDYVDGDRRRCRERFNWLLEILREKVPESSRIEKDF